MATVDGISDELLEFALFALDHAAAGVIPTGGPLVPFSLVDVQGERSLHRFPGDLQQGLAAARETIRAHPNASMAAVAWDGYLTSEGSRMDAVLVEASEAGADRSVIMAQRYGPAGGVLRKRMQAIGNPAIVDFGEPMF